MTCVMRIVEFFSTYTCLPVLIDDVIEQTKEMTGIRDIELVDVDMPTSTLRGMVRVAYSMAPYASGELTSWIYLSNEIQDPRMRRLVCCKEILHLFDDDAHMARSREQVDALVNDIVMPGGEETFSSPTTMSDRTGMGYALLVLLPRAALDILREEHRKGRLSENEIADLAMIPVAWVRLALSEPWRAVVDMIGRSAPAGNEQGSGVRSVA